MRISRVVRVRRRPPMRRPEEIARDMLRLAKESYLLLVADLGDTHPGT